MKHVLDVVEETISKSALDDFKNYIKKLPMCKKWMIHSDYCIGDKNKPNDVVVFSVVPYVYELEDFKSLISSSIPRDIKETKIVSEKGINLLKSGLFFHFCFLLGKKKDLFKAHSNDDEKANIRKALIETRKMISAWEGENGSQIEYYASIVENIDTLLREMESKGFNLKLLKNIMLISILGAYVAHLLTKEASAEVVGWFSDRDCITAAYNNIAHDFFHLNHHGLTERDSVDKTKFKIVIGVPEDEPGSKMWYDPQNRLPDHVAGALADWNIPQNTVSKPKFTDMLSKCLIETPLFAIIKCHLKAEDFRCSRLELRPETEKFII